MKIRSDGEFHEALRHAGPMIHIRDNDNSEIKDDEAFSFRRRNSSNFNRENQWQEEN